MRRLNAIAVAAIAAFAALAGPALADVTAFEGVRLVVGNGNVVENATLVIDGNKIVQAGQGVAVPAGGAGAQYHMRTRVQVRCRGCLVGRPCGVSNGDDSEHAIGLGHVDYGSSFALKSGGFGLQCPQGELLRIHQ